MDDIVETLSARYGGLVPARALAEQGVNAHAAARLVERGILVRLRRGMCADASVWQAGGAEQARLRHGLLVRTAVHSSKHPIVVSHLSAAAMHGLPLIGTWPRTVHTVEPEAAGGSSSRFTTSHRGAPTPVAVNREGVSVTSLARTLVDIASTCSLLVAVTMIDHALRVEIERAGNEARMGMPVAPALTKEELYAELAAVSPSKGLKQAERAIAFANPLAANPGESMSRVRIFELGFEVPELQVLFPNIGGRNYWVDYFWRGIRMVGEFDGKVKYTRGAILGDRAPEEVVWQEKRREDTIRSRVNRFIRWDWDTAIAPRRFYEFLLSEDVPRA